MRWAERVARTVEERRVEGFGGGNLKEGHHFEDPEVDRRLILNWTFSKWDGRHGLE